MDSHGTCKSGPWHSAADVVMFVRPDNVGQGRIGRGGSAATGVRGGFRGSTKWSGASQMPLEGCSF